MHNLSIEHIAELVKTLSDNNQCLCCDKLNTPCVRYPCGHSVCEACVSVAESCLLCITPPSKVIHFDDEPLSLRVKHVSDLFSAFQELFGVDVNKISSLSKQLKLEKQLFPECIQATNKYYNKRKSSNNLSKGKENRKSKLVLPGEEVSNRSFIEMENRNNYVEEWVNNSKNSLSLRKKQRKPFADINVNQNQQECITKEPQIKDNRKRKHFEVTSNSTDYSNVPEKKNKENIVKNNKPVKCSKNTKKSYEEERDVNESGIVIDSHDDVEEIMDSQEGVIDKDKLACLAIAEAEPKVPFYKKGLLHTFCNATDIQSVNRTKCLTNFKKITKTIENKSFLIRINVSNYENLPSCSTSIATKYSNIDKQHLKNVKPSHNPKEKKVQEIPLNVLTETSHTLLPGVEENNDSGFNSKVHLEESVATVRRAVVINDSDTDSSLDDIGIRVKRTDNLNSNSVSGAFDSGVLANLQPGDLLNRSRHTRRETSPRSTDSSDKENYDPNRMKRMKPGKNIKCKQILKRRFF